VTRPIRPSRESEESVSVAVSSVLGLVLLFALGAALLDFLFERGWLERMRGSRS